MSTPTPSLETARDPRRWLVLAVMSIGTLIVFLDGTVINTALPNISTKLSATTSQLQWVVDSYILVLAGLLLLGGTMGDRFGRRRWMSIGLLIFVGRLRARRPLEHHRDAHRRPSGAGPRRRARAAGNAVDRHQRLPTRRTGEGDRDLDRRRRPRRRDRPGRRRLPRRALGLQRRVLDPRTDPRPRRRRHAVRQRIARPPPGRARRPRSVDRHPRRRQPRLRHHPGRRVGLDLHHDPQRARHLRRLVPRVHLDRTARRTSDAAAALLPPARLHRQRRGPRHRVLRRHRAVLLPQPVLAARPGPHPVQGRADGACRTPRRSSPALPSPSRCCRRSGHAGSSAPPWSSWAPASRCSPPSTSTHRRSGWSAP